MALLPLLLLLALAAAHAFDLNAILAEVADHNGVADQIIDLVTTGAQKGQVYQRLAKFTDTIGNRLCGSENLERAVQYMLKELSADGLDNVHAEPVQLPHWVRGVESARMSQPRDYSFSILGLGWSVGTSPAGITGEVLVVSSFDELTNRSAEARGKIIVFNDQCDWATRGNACYGVTVAYRDGGATAAAKVGGIAALMRSAAAFSINSPHTGVQMYADGVNKIPAACITVEDAEMFTRMQARGQKMVVTVKMDGTTTLPNVTGHNVVAELKGSTFPDQVVLVSGHLDSWDVGQGAMDDGGGAFISWQVLSLIKQLGIRPKRTLRMVMWSCEEFGGIGAYQYFDAHKADIRNFDLVMESDGGVFTPTGLAFTGNADATAIMRATAALLPRVNATQLLPGGGGEDIGMWIEAGVPGGSLANMNQKYFWFHHSGGDTMTVLSSTDMDLCTAVWAVHAFTIADLSTMLPR